MLFRSRPSHCYHSYFMANTRICLGVEVCGGKDHAAQHGLPGLWELLGAVFKVARKLAEVPPFRHSPAPRRRL